MSIIEKVIDKLEVEGKPNGENGILPEDEQAVEDATAKKEKASSPISEEERHVNLDLTRLKSMGFLTPDSINLKLAEQFRRIKLPILANAFGPTSLVADTRNLLMVSSALQNEGKSFTSFNLAVSIAKEFNNTVLYIDADLTQRMMEKVLGIPPKPGLVDYLLDGNHQLGDLLLKTNIPRLTLLPSGRVYDRITELWSSNKMGELLDELSKRYNDRFIIFDAPPLLQDSSASILSRLVGQVILIVEAEKTPRHIVEEAVKLVDESKYVALVLNKSNQRESSDYGYYYSED